ncbi:MAG TPA: HIT domain-containing protein [Candidatus Acidoferrales bacterium]|nr:HIT domain-containing protein [Candidatus Acidoferrales bacterium]
MDYLWTPWRYRYIADTSKAAGCIFCDAIAANDDVRMLVVFRGKKNYIILNRYPYTSGHVMVVPYAHVSDFAAAEVDTLAEMMQLAQRVQIALEKGYHPEGYNLGMNLGRAAGAGVIGHIHLHVLPRWCGDSNFMTVTGETRVEPEDLVTTYEKLRASFD